jgi:hypothetical protein
LLLFSFVTLLASAARHKDNARGTQADFQARFRSRGLSGQEVYDDRAVEN